MTPAAEMENVSRDGGGDALDRPPWTCPFCALHCDGFRVDVASSLELVGSDCPKAREGLSHFSGTPSQPSPLVGGSPVSLEQALDAAAAHLARARQPLIGGLATDVAGARAAFRLAEATGAIVDHLRGASLMHGVRAIQDRGTYYTTLAEIRNRADLLVCVATCPSERYPEFFRRCGIAGSPPAELPARRIVFLGTDIDPAVRDAPRARAESVRPQGDAYATLAALAAATAGRTLRESADDIAHLADALRNARYAVIVWEPAQLDEHGALAAEAINALVGTLNRSTRAASFALGGSDGAYTANQVFTWLSGLPLRTGMHPHRMAHEPVRYSSERLLRDATVDALVWISSFRPQPVPQRRTPHVVVLGHPAMASAADVASAATVFIPVSTPGIGSAGHLFRVDGGIALPLRPLYADALPTVASVLDQIGARLRAPAPGKPK